MSDRAATVPHMGKKALFDRAGMADLLARQSGVITRSQAQDCAMSDQALRHRLRPDGPWQVLLPGVYLTTTGSPAGPQRLMAAQLYAGRDSAITGPAALVLHNIRAPQTQMVDVLIPHGRRRSSLGFVRVHRTARMPNVVLWVGAVGYVPLVRAVADTARSLRDVGEVRAVVADGVQRRRLHVSQLADELARGPVQGSAGFRQVLAEVGEGVRSSAEGDLRTLIKRERIPDPMYNPRLYAGDSFIAEPDAWWTEAGVAGEIESREWHLSPRDWERTLARDARMSAYGIIVLHFPPRRLRTEPQVVAAEIRSALAAGRSRGPMGIRALPAG
jgi:hypothetical protein